jgi:hypothetical protein
MFVKGKLLKKFSLKIPFKIFHASAKVRASLLPLARIREKILEKGYFTNGKRQLD